MKQRVLLWLLLLRQVIPIHASMNTLSAVVLMPTRIGPTSPNVPAERFLTATSQRVPRDVVSLQGLSASGCRS